MLLFAEPPTRLPLTIGARHPACVVRTQRVCCVSHKGFRYWRTGVGMGHLVRELGTRYAAAVIARCRVGGAVVVFSGRERTRVLVRPSICFLRTLCVWVDRSRGCTPFAPAVARIPLEPYGLLHNSTPHINVHANTPSTYYSATCSSVKRKSAGAGSSVRLTIEGGLLRREVPSEATYDNAESTMLPPPHLSQVSTTQTR